MKCERKLLLQLKNGKKMHLLFSHSLRQTSVTTFFFLLELVFFSIILFFVRWDMQVKFFWLIESLWSQMKQLQSKELAISAAGLKRIALNFWRKILPSYLKSLYESMPRRMKADIDAQGGHTKYWTYSLHVFVLFIE